MGCYFKGPVGVDNPTIINKLKQSQRIKQDNNNIKPGILTILCRLDTASVDEEGRKGEGKLH